MDRRSWLWRRKSSEKSPGGGETESSGSLSSHSEKFFDDQVCSNHNTQSPEVTSKATPSYEELNDSVKRLTDKLSAALLNIRAKEDLVKQHAKVAEEAVVGWEKAESEVVVLKQQLEVATKTNSAHEDRILHLNGALKECVRQLRLAREEHDQKLNDVIAKKTHEWGSTKSEQESQAFTSKLMAVEKKLEAAEKENSVLKLELLSRDEELEMMIIERDLSTQAAEMASKQHLESIKKVARLEAECRRLKAVARKASNDNKSVTASSIYVESFTDSQSDSGERLLLLESDDHKTDGSEPNECMKALGRNPMVPSVDINLMEDFLEMERIAALPRIESGPLSYQTHEGESPLKADLEAMIYRTAELEEKLEKVEMEKKELEIELGKCQDQVKKLNDRRIEIEARMVELRTLLSQERDARLASEAKIEATSARRECAESQLVEAEAEMKTLLAKIGYLEEEVEKKRALEAKMVELRSQLSQERDVRLASEAKIEATSARRECAESQLVETEAEMKTLLAKIGYLEEEVEKKRALEAKMVELRTQLSQERDVRLASEAKIEATSARREWAESQLVETEAEMKTLLAKIGYLEEDVEKERALSGEAVVKCRKMEDEILRMKREVEIWNSARLNGDLKLKQEKELSVAAGKLSECQKTIASLGKQLKSLATSEDFQIDSDQNIGAP